MAIDPLVTLDATKLNLRVTSTDEDDDILMKMSQATYIVLKYIKALDTEWDEDTVPDDVQAAILAQVRILYETDRKDADAVSDFSSHPPDGYLHPSVARYVYDRRLLTLA